MSGWRYTTIDCIRVWKFYQTVGPAERVRALLPACTRAGALALPLLAGPAAGPLLAAPVVPELPWIGAPGWVQAALPFGPGGYRYGPGGFGGSGYAGGFGAAGYAFPRPEGYEQQAVATQLIAQGYQSVGGEQAPGGNHPGEGLTGAPRPGSAPMPTPDTPTDVPEPSALAVFAVAVLGVAAGRRRYAS